MNKDARRNPLSGIRAQLLAMSILPLLIASVVSIWAAIASMKSGLQEEALDQLKSVCVAVKASFDTMNADDYALNEAGELIKGDFNITANTAELDQHVEGTDTDVTLFYGDTRKATTLIDAVSGERIIGTTASEAVAKAVLGGEEYSALSLTINNENYYAYYIPLKNPDGTIIGMVFAGAPSATIDRFISFRCLFLIGVVVVVAVIAFIVIMILSGRLVKAVNNAKEAIDSLAAGDLTYTIDDSVLQRKDEIGDMVRGAKECIDHLNSTIGDIQNYAKDVLTNGEALENMALETSETSTNISSTVDDLSTGAVSLAEDIESATLRIDEMGQLIESIVSNIESLNSTSADMRDASAKAMDIMHELDVSNNKTREAVLNVAENVAETDESVNRIQDAVTMIMSVAAQTNLLSLNAAIEAARAGEVGRGFAVVASEIQKLSEESNSSAQLISEIITKLSAASHNSLKMMEEVKARIQEQQDKLESTKNQVDSVNDGIRTSNESTESINGQAQSCDNARGGVIDIIQNLSAISQENAASSEETATSMSELNETIRRVAEAAEQLKGLAVALDEGTQFFKLK